MSNEIPRVSRLVEALSAAGITCRHRDDLRYAVHEACHALDWSLEHPWTNSRIRAASEQRTHMERCLSEVRVRVVEGLVCAKLGVEIEPMPERISIAILEAVKGKYELLGGSQGWIAMATKSEKSLEVTSMAARILAMAEEKP